MISLVTVIVLLPSSVSFGDAVYLAGAAGRLNAVTTNFDWNDRFNIWSGLIGGTFLFLSYFGCDQSQVQRYLTGQIDRAEPPEPAVQRRGQDPDAVLHPVHRRHGVRVLPVRAAAGAVPAGGTGAHRADRRVPADRASSTSRPSSSAGRRRWRWWKRTTRATPPAKARQQRRVSRGAEGTRRRAHQRVASWWRPTGGEKGFSDTNYIFLSFVTRYLPAGIVGLVIAVIFAATMSASSGEINSLATVTVIDIYQRHFKRDGSDHHYLMASRWATLFWGVYAVVFAGWAQAAGIADRGGEQGGLAVLRLAAGMLRAGVRVPAGARHGDLHRACWRAKRRSSRPLASPTFPGSGTT